MIPISGTLGLLAGARSGRKASILRQISMARNGGDKIKARDFVPIYGAYRMGQHYGARASLGKKLRVGGGIAALLAAAGAGSAITSKMRERREARSKELDAARAEGAASARSSS